MPPKRVQVKKVLKPMEEFEAVSPTRPKVSVKPKGKKIAEIKAENMETIADNILTPLMVDLIEARKKAVKDINTFLRAGNPIPAAEQTKMRDYFIKLDAAILNTKPERVVDFKDLEKKAMKAKDIGEALHVFKQAAKPREKPLK